ncbi:Beta-barrel assembly machine subunit BamC [Sulfuritortus calidifontis]|uniref:Beta-barrel assembly machine subunit BamC n=1 Tax=Sulfuritortus calidifontis TaxID=1914471 RepID=A0A4R3K132_9PROT|nr:outer membrane protein assembly factor BamC [Sulfuritortus calidifontis]TCS73956.1 Beta-barrel assembly machine subunit BamC [Sulfuritortus calidifontis]
MRTTALALLAAALVLGGCSFVESKKIDYKSAGSLPSLEVPPDLILPSGDKRFAVPDTAVKGSATYSAYSAERSGQKTTGNSQLLPAIDKVSIQRSGSQRWLVVQLPPQEVWPVVKDFWQEMGFLVNLELPDAGVIETDWAENRAKIPQDMIRNFLGKVIDSVYSTAERDKFRTRLEPSADGKSTEIYISHRGMFEVFEGTVGGGDQGTGRTVWQPRPADPELEAEMLRRLMVRFGVEEVRAKSMLAEKVFEPRASKIQSADGAAMLSIPEGFDRAWRRVGLALDRVGFAVEDRNRAAGVYYVRYADPDAGSKKEKGFLSKLAFWSSDDSKALSQRYRVQVAQKGDATQVAVLEESGQPLKNETAQRIINLLYEQLK